MPITRRQFELGINDDIEEWMREAHAFFSMRRDEAFSTGEIAQNLEADSKAGGTRDLRRGLEALERVLAIQKRVVRGKTYYAFWHEMNPETWEEKVAGLAR